MSIGKLCSKPPLLYAKDSLATSLVSREVRTWRDAWVEGTLRVIKTVSVCWCEEVEDDVETEDEDDDEADELPEATWYAGGRSKVSSFCRCASLETTSTGCDNRMLSSMTTVWIVESRSMMKLSRGDGTDLNDSQGSLLLI